MIYPILFLVFYITGYLCGKRQLFYQEKKEILKLNLDFRLKELKHKFIIGGPFEIKKGKRVIARTTFKRFEIWKVKK